MPHTHSTPNRIKFLKLTSRPSLIRASDQISRRMQVDACAVSLAYLRENAHTFAENGCSIPFQPEAAKINASTMYLCPVAPAPFSSRTAIQPCSGEEAQGIMTSFGLLGMLPAQVDIRPRSRKYDPSASILTASTATPQNKQHHHSHSQRTAKKMMMPMMVMSMTVGVMLLRLNAQASFATPPPPPSAPEWSIARA